MSHGHENTEEIFGTTGDDTITALEGTLYIEAGGGFDTVVLSGDYADYTFTPTHSLLNVIDSHSELMSLYGVERLQFDDGIVDILHTGGGEMLVNTTTASHQFNPQTAVFADGGFIVVWGTENEDSYAVNAQRYDANGDPDGDELVIETGLGGLVDCSVAVSTTGDDAGSYAIYYDSGVSNDRAIVLYNDDHVEINSTSYQYYGVAEDGNGNFLTYFNGYSEFHILNSDNLSDIHDLNSGYRSTYGEHNHLGDNRFVSYEATSRGELNDVNLSQLRASIKDYDNEYNFTSDGYHYLGAAQSSTEIQERDPVATGLEDGGYVIVWQSRSQDSAGQVTNDIDISDYDIYAQRFDYQGNATGINFQVNTYSVNQQINQDVVGLSDGGFVVVWESYAQDGSLSGIFAQRYNVDGNPEGDEFQVNDYSSSSQSNPSVSALPNGGFVVSWESFGQDGSGDGIVAKVYDADGNPLPTMSLGELNDSSPMLASFTMLNSVDDNTTTINDTPLFFEAEVVSAAQVSNAVYGADYSTNPSEKIIKLTLNADIDNLNDDSITSITAAGLDIGLDWSQFEVMSYADNSTKWFDSESNTSNFFEVRQDITTGQLESVVVASLDVSSTPSLTLVDNITSDGIGEADQPSTLVVGEVYLNPINSLDSVSLTYGGGVVTNQGDTQFVQATKSLNIDTNPVDAIIATDDGDVLINVNVEAYKAGVDQNVSTEVNNSGEMWFHQSVDIDEVKLSDSGVYNFDTSINISDAIDVLRHIVDLEAIAEGSNAYHAADTDNNDTINISDAIGILRHIVNLETIDTFDLLDGEGNRVTQLDADASGDAVWTIVANGDVDMNGSFAEDYVASDIL